MAAALAVRLSRMLATSAYLGGDPAARALLGEGFVDHGWSFLHTAVWLPLHPLILAGCSRIIPDRELAARLPGVVAGALCAWPTFVLGRRAAGAVLARSGSAAAARAGGWIAGTAAAALVAVEPLGIVYGSVAYPEPLTVLLALAGIAALTGAGGGASGRPARAPGWVLAVPALGAAALMRYDTWPLAGVVAACAPAGRILRGIAAAVALAPALAWVGTSPATVLSNNAAEAVPQLAAEWAANLAYYPRVALDFSGTWLVPLGLVGLGLAALAPGARALPLAFAGPSLFLLATAALRLTGPQQRYAQLPLALLGVAAGVAVGVAAGALVARRGTWAAVALLVLAPVAGEVRAARCLESGWRADVPAGLDAAARRLGREWRSREAARPPGVPPTRAAIDPHEWAAPHLIWASGIPEVHAPVVRDEGDPEGVARLVAGLAAGPSLALAADGGHLPRLLDLPPHTCGTEVRGPVTLRCLGRDGGYRLYAVEPTPAPGPAP
ncbi:hypothetical protein L6R50_21960 [Myxococcota bacterium]|nr:hypothetical protein [Myxococcota bacterium]